LSGHDAKHLHMILTLAGHKCHSLLGGSVVIGGTTYDSGRLRFDGKDVPLQLYTSSFPNDSPTGTAYYTYSDHTIDPKDTYLNVVQAEFSNGDPSSSSQPFPRLHADIENLGDMPDDYIGESDWTNNHLQRGCAKVHLRLRWSEDDPQGKGPFSNGIPNQITF